MKSEIPALRLTLGRNARGVVHTMQVREKFCERQGTYNDVLAYCVQTLRENTRQLRFEVVSDPGQGMGATIEFLYSPPVHKAS